MDTFDVVMRDVGDEIFTTEGVDLRTSTVKSFVKSSPTLLPSLIRTRILIFPGVSEIIVLLTIRPIPEIISYVVDVFVALDGETVRPSVPGIPV